MTQEPERPALQREKRILILAPTGDDQEVITAAAAEGSFTAEVAADMAHLCAAIGEGAGAVVLVDAGYTQPDVAALRATLRKQPAWSALPICVVCADVGRDEARQRFLHLVGLLQPMGQEVHVSERPLDSRLLIRWLDVALDARRRQYAARDLMKQLDLERRRQLAVLAALPVGIMVQDAGGRVLETNAALQRIWGAMPIVERAEDLRAFKARTGTGRETSPFESRFARVVATGQPVIEEELEIDAFDGVRRTILGSALPIRCADGKVAGVVGVQVDITERARAQRATRILSEATAALIESLDLDVTLRTLSRIVVQHFACACVVDELDEHGELRRLVAESYAPGTADEAARLLAYAPVATGNSLAARVLRSGKAVLVSEVPGDWLATGLEADEHRAAFEKIGVYSLMVLPLAARGRPLGVLGIVSTRPDRHYDARDLALAEEISRRAALALDNARLHRRAEAALRARDDTLAEVDAFLNAAPVGFVLLDRELRFRRVNPVFARWHQESPDELLGRAYEDLVSSECEAQMAPLLGTVLRTGEPLFKQEVSGELPVGSGRRKHLLASFMPVLDVDGTPRAVGIVVTDVTELKQVEEALREEGVFRERFIGVLAHDLRNPLHAIVGSAGTLLRQDDAPPTWARTVGRIASAAGRMARMIGNLLDLARSREGGGIRLTRKPADLADVVREVVSELEASHPGREIAVSVEGDTQADLDPDRMAQVVSNLAGNALAYSPAKSVVRVAVDGRDGELTLTVHNAGAPILPETQRTIFSPFQRGAAGGAEPPSMRGLGLGLFIVGEIARAHGGTVAVSSTAEEGTTFTVRLPRAGATAMVLERA